mmetsp:Transcript_37793/g.47695  ORF Transcript_37793/g.47695 Transcript_37793/m.47695 type:complete len:309 (+) Transcript_37793:257-1183(+)
MQSKRPPCRFFALGKCRFGEACTFSHEAEGRQVVCKFYTGEPGSCRYGKNCLFQHLTPDEVKADEEKLEREQEETKAEVDHQTCGVCFENIPAQGKRYGLLTACDHVFCYECVREWRQRGGAGTGRRAEATLRRACPSCRRLSEYVLPSRDFFTTGPEKEALMKAYKEELAKIPCKNFNARTKSGCQFAKNCYFAHLNEEGEDIKDESRPPPRPRPHPHRCPFSLPEIGARLSRLRMQLEALRGGDGEFRLDAEDMAMLRMLGIVDITNELGIELEHEDEDGSNESDSTTEEDFSDYYSAIANLSIDS